MIVDTEYVENQFQYRTQTFFLSSEYHFLRIRINAYRKKDRFLPSKASLRLPSLLTVKLILTREHYYWIPCL